MRCYRRGCDRPGTTRLQCLPGVVADSCPQHWRALAAGWMKFRRPESLRERYGPAGRVPVERFDRTAGRYLLPPEAADIAAEFISEVAA